MTRFPISASSPVLTEAAPPPPRQVSRLPALFGGLCVGVLLGGIAVSSLYDRRSLGERLDAGLLEVQRSGEAVAEASLAQAQEVQGVLDDGAISTRVRTALAADPALSALKIRVNTRDGIVALDGPAPDRVARDRATVLAQAPAGVRGVYNRLKLPGEGAS
jgi:osmotically-inducible protein OsmY